LTKPFYINTHAQNENVVEPDAYTSFQITAKPKILQVLVNGESQEKSMTRNVNGVLTDDDGTRVKMERLEERISAMKVESNCGLEIL